MKNCIYRFLNKDNEIIYIGKAKDLKQRINSHAHLPKECYEERVRIEYIEFNTEDEMDFAERYYIPKHKPKYNKAMNHKVINISLKEFDDKKWTNFKKQTIKQSKKIALSENKNRKTIDYYIQESIFVNKIKINKEFEKNRNRKIIILSTGEVFDNIQSFKHFSKTHWSINRLLDYCNGEKIFLDIKHPNYYGTTMQPCYLDEFLKKNSLKDWEHQFMKHTRKIICLTTGEIFNNCYEIQAIYNIKNAIRCCLGLNNYIGSYNNTPLVWKWYDEYLSMNREEIESYINKANDVYCKRSKQYEKVS